MFSNVFVKNDFLIEFRKLLLAFLFFFWCLFCYSYIYIIITLFSDTIKGKIILEKCLIYIFLLSWLWISKKFIFILPTNWSKLFLWCFRRTTNQLVNALCQYCDSLTSLLKSKKCFSHSYKIRWELPIVLFSAISSVICLLFWWSSEHNLKIMFRFSKLIKRTFCTQRRNMKLVKLRKRTFFLLKMRKIASNIWIN